MKEAAYKGLQEVQRRRFSGQLFVFLRKKCFVAVCDLLHDVETKHDLC